MSRQFTKELTAEWLEEMRNDLKPGDTLHTIVRHRAASGMSRHIDVYRFTCEGGKVVKHWLSPRIAAVCGFTFDEKKESIRISGCGMDMAQHVVYSLGRVLWPDGFGEHCTECTYRPRTKKEAETCNHGIVEMAYHVFDSDEIAHVTGRWDGDFDSSGKRKFIPAHGGFPLYLFEREIASEHTVTAHSFYGRNGNTSGWDNDGGFALKSELI